MSKRTGYSRAFAPRRDKALKKTRQEMAKKFGEKARNYDCFGIGKQVEINRSLNKSGKEINDFFNKTYNKIYRGG